VPSRYQRAGKAPDETFDPGLRFRVPATVTSALRATAAPPGAPARGSRVTSPAISTSVSAKKPSLKTAVPSTETEELPLKTTVELNSLGPVMRRGPLPVMSVMQQVSTMRPTISERLATRRLARPVRRRPGPVEKSELTSMS
jgi:hypothetical protein